jgi:hypothetical protein
MANEGIRRVTFDPATRECGVFFLLPERGTFRPDTGGGLDAAGKEASKREMLAHGTVAIPGGVVLVDGAKIEVNAYAPTPYGLGVKAARKGGSSAPKPTFTITG